MNERKKRDNRRKKQGGDGPSWFLVTQRAAEGLTGTTVLVDEL